MALRCGCSAEGDEIVFGPVHECSKNPGLRYAKRSLPPLVPSWAFVVPAERPYETTLDEQERTGD